MIEIDCKNMDWYYLLFCAIYLSPGLTGWKLGFLIAIAMATNQLIHTLMTHRRVTTFPVQVRIAYTLLLLAALPDSMNWLCWLPAIGTWLYFLFSYCLQARTLSLFPFISGQIFSLKRVRAALLARSVNNILTPA